VRVRAWSGNTEPAEEAGSVNRRQGDGLVWRGNHIVPAASDDKRPEREARRMHPKRQKNPKARRPTVKDRQLDAMIKEAWKAGWWADKRPSGHVMCYHPTNLNEKVLVNNTAGDRHVVRNVRSLFRKAGLKL
jgi:hypothetical protein